MRSSTPNRTSPQVTALFRADKRFDALVKEQNAEHEHKISAHNKEMQDLRDALRLSMERFDSIVERNQEDLNAFKADSARHIGILQEKLRANEALIQEQRVSIQDLHAQIMSIHVHFSSKKDAEDLRRSFLSQMNSVISNNLNELQSHQVEYKNSFETMQKEINKNISDLSKQISLLKEKVDVNFNLSTLDKEGVLREVRLYKNDVFVIQKKIENIYTLIERINNKRGAS